MLLYKIIHFILLKKKNFFSFNVLLIICLFKNILTSYFPCLTKVKFQLKIQMNGLIGLKKLFIKSILNTTIINIFVMFKKLATVPLEKFIVQIGKIRKIIILN